MKKIILTLVLSTISLISISQVHVRGYYRKSGTYVQPHQRTFPNETKLDNYSTFPNINPHTGKTGTIRVTEIPKIIKPDPILKNSTEIKLPPSASNFPMPPKMSTFYYR